MPVEVTSIQIDLGKKNILAFSFADEADQSYFEQHVLKHFTEEMRAFLADPSQVVAVIALIPGQDVKLLKIDTSEVVDANTPPDKPN